MVMLPQCSSSIHVKRTDISCSPFTHQTSHLIAGGFRQIQQQFPSINPCYYWSPSYYAPCVLCLSSLLQCSSAWRSSPQRRLFHFFWSQRPAIPEICKGQKFSLCLLTRCKTFSACFSATWDCCHLQARAAQSRQPVSDAAALPASALWPVDDRLLSLPTAGFSSTPGLKFRR